MSKVMFCIPPIKSSLGQAQAAQNRQYQYFKDPTYIYPVIPAIFITMILTNNNYQTIWLDCVAEGMDDDEFSKLLVQVKPDWVVFEANTMLFNKYCQIINDIKNNIKDIKIILCGEHATAMPEEAKEKCKADLILQGGKWYFEAYKAIVGHDWGKDRLLPHINRNATRWWLYAYANGNYKYTPATYMMAGQDCFYRPKHADGSSASCTFCTWVHYHPENVVRPVADYLEEVEELITFGFREFFDDSGTFPPGKWLREFCQGMIDRGYNEYISWGCNMRFGVCSKEDFELMAKAGCRFILWGFESANQYTLDKLSKGYKINKVSHDLYITSKLGIWNHLTVMMGYPWETLEEERRTYTMVRFLLLKGFASSMQSTIFMPYPGTTSFKQLKEEGLILTEDWDKWDMAHEVVKLKYPFKEALKLQSDYYNISYHPKFFWQKIKRIRSVDDLKQYWMLSKKVINRMGKVFNEAGVR